MADKRSKRNRGRGCSQCLEGIQKRTNKTYQLKEIPQWVGLTPERLRTKLEQRFWESSSSAESQPASV